jgi:hypothetical protein
MPTESTAAINFPEPGSNGANQMATQTFPTCPGCSGSAVMTDDPSILRCERCGGVFNQANDPITPEQADRYVRVTAPMQDNAVEGSFYFDFFIVMGVDIARLRPTRIHGWACSKTKRIVQIG